MARTYQRGIPTKRVSGVMGVLISGGNDKVVVQKHQIGGICQDVQARLLYDSNEIDKNQCQ